MGQMAMVESRYDDPRKLRDLLTRVSDLATGHALHSVIVGIAGQEGDLLLPEVIDYVESALRVDDSIFRMTRERAVLVLTDVDREKAGEIVERLLIGFREHFSTAEGPDLELGFYEVTPEETSEVSVKRVLTAVFAAGG